MSFLWVGPLAADEAQSVLTTKDLDILQWRHIGPWTFSGRITDFAVPKGQSQVYYVATASGGVWKTEDGGIHFEPIFDKYGNMSIGNIEVAPSDPNIVYLGTGEAMHARSSAHGNGMWKSTDAGKTWKFIGLEYSYFIPKIAIDDKNPDVVYVASEGKLYDNSMDCQRGFYIADIHPLKEFKKEVLEKDAHLFDIQRVIKWRMLERRGQQYGEFARTTNPPNEAKIYYYLKDEVDKVEIVVQDLEGKEIQKITGSSGKGLQQSTWNLRRSAPQAQAGQRRARQGEELAAGVYKIVFFVDGEEIQTKKLEILEDPILK